VANEEPTRSGPFPGFQYIVTEKPNGTLNFFPMERQKITEDGSQPSFILRLDQLPYLWFNAQITFTSVLDEMRNVWSETAKNSFGQNVPQGTHGFGWNTIELDVFHLL